MIGGLDFTPVTAAIERIAQALEALAYEKLVQNKLTERSLVLQERAVRVQEELARDSLQLRAQLEGDA